MGQLDSQNKAASQRGLPLHAGQAQAANELDPKTEQTMLLARAVEREIIPRLMRAHGAVDGAPRQASSLITKEDVERLTDLVLNGEDSALHQSLADLRQRGASVQSIFLDLLAPTARKLGDHWDCDVCSFTEVTVAMGRLQQLVRANSSAFGLGSHFHEGQLPPRRVLLLPAPGEQHTFGLSLVAEFFYRAGWDVSTSFIQPTGSLSALVEREWFDVACMSLGNVGNIRSLTESLQQIRRASMNPQMLTIAGGVAFMIEPELAQQVGADAVITDAETAPELVESLLKQASLQP